MRQRAFSLIELLVVVSIIAIIMAIALPALGRARRTAADAMSQTNLKALGQWHNVWTTEHKNEFYNPFLNVSAPNMAAQTGYTFRWIGEVAHSRYDTEGFAVYWYSFLNQSQEQLKLPLDSFVSPLDAPHRESLRAKRAEDALIPGSYFYSAAFWKGGFGYCSFGNEYGGKYRNVPCESHSAPAATS